MPFPPRLNDFFAKKVQINPRRGKWTLCEKNPPPYSVEIEEKNNDLCVVKLDDPKIANQWYADKQPICDYVIFLEYEQSIKIILIELKSTNIDHEQAAKQLEMGKNLCTYLLKAYHMYITDDIDVVYKKVKYKKMVLYKLKNQAKNVIQERPKTNGIEYKPYGQRPIKFSKLIKDTSYFKPLIL